ncbi:DNA-3-methyladenine glycosylase [Xylanimonas ulmi]|uniref:Putative 3-methyladenine DNA glycosylase n=1 Tax=Xylanimonas ulmi TaxID=228973 RepID=A0A4Q7M1W5_9MICO|nr:DNA-3-methyladenine glycosylase [Xylanibacterium ulmi]RZS61241.1 DNA-3-methyladenine glycosylase [Xylanibacterium ulmi]
MTTTDVSPWDVPGRAWYARDVRDVARDLLGACLVRRTEAGVVALRLTEVEAYDGADDPGSHAYRGRTRRNATMFGEPGRLYVYRHLGLHHCVNVVCGPVGRAAAVLLRAGEVVAGADLARARRVAVGVCDSDRQLARGPARLTVALALDLSDDGADLTDPRAPLVMTLPVDRERGAVATGPRVGVGGEGGRADLYPWRSWLVGEPTVSAYRPVSPRRR